MSTIAQSSDEIRSHVADAYTAMTETRPFRPSLPPEAALLELKTNGGSQFDPVVVEAIINHAETFGVASSSTDTH